MLNCKDGSDEQVCHKVMPNIGYNKLLTPPPLQGDQFFYVNVSLDFKHILYIHEEKHYIRIAYSIQKDWYDSFLTFQNLKEDKANPISQDDKNMIWWPWLTIKNVVDTSKRTDETEILKVVPNQEFHFKHNSIEDYQNALLFEESSKVGLFYSII